MNIEPTLDNFEDWYRCGRGHQINFYATTKEIQNWLLDYLPPGYAPYRLLVSYPDRVSPVHGLWHFGVHELEDFTTIMRWPDPPITFNIWSQRLTPMLLAGTPEAIKADRWWGSWGLPYFQHRLNETSRFAVAKGVVHAPTGTTIIYEDYIKLFKYVSLRIRKHLIRSVIDMAQNDMEMKLETMTQGAVRHKFHPAWIRPGRLLAK